MIASIAQRDVVLGPTGRTLDPDNTVSAANRLRRVRRHSRANPFSPQPTSFVNGRYQVERSSARAARSASIAILADSDGRRTADAVLGVGR